jgi:hypothetical protein
MTRYRINRVMLIPLLLGLLFTASCGSLATLTEPMPPQAQSYDLPKELDATAVIHAVERSFAEVLLTAPRTVEGAVPSPLPVRPHHFAVNARTISLDRLGNVLIPTVACPQHLAVISAWPMHLDGFGNVRQYTACIQPYAEGYRVTIIVSAPRIDDPLQRETKEDIDFARIGKIVKTLQSEISLVKNPVASRVAPGVSPATGGVAFPKPETLSEHRAPALRPQHASALPLVCLAPKGGHAANLQSHPGGGRVVGTVVAGSILAVAEPLDTAYFKVETERGAAGWVSRSEVTRLSCPIG